jgi:hypothetical protein
MSKRMILVLGQKGGTGKSTASCAILDRLRRDDIPCAAYDGDGSDVGQLHQFYGQRGPDGRPMVPQDPIRGVVPYDIRHEGQRDLLLNSLQTGASVVLHDLPGGSLLPVIRVAGSAAALASMATEAGYRITLAVVLSPALASALVVGDILDQFGTSVDYLAIRNRFYTRIGGFDLFDGHTDATGEPMGGKSKQRLLAANGKIIDMPSLMEGETYWKLEALDLGFTAGCRDPRLSIAHRSRIGTFLRDFDAELDKVRDRIGLP